MRKDSGNQCYGLKDCLSELCTNERLLGLGIQDELNHYGKIIIIH